jgi:hypothetical protein
MQVRSPRGAECGAGCVGTVDVGAMLSALCREFTLLLCLGLLLGITSLIASVLRPRSPLLLGCSPARLRLLLIGSPTGRR